MIGLGSWYTTGIASPNSDNTWPFLERDETKAFELVQRASESNQPRALFTLGYFYQNGIGTSCNPDLAVKHYQAAASQGYDRATKKLKELTPNSKGNRSGGLFSRLFTRNK